MATGRSKKKVGDHNRSLHAIQNVFACVASAGNSLTVATPIFQLEVQLCLARGLRNT